MAGNGIRAYRRLPPARGTHLEGTGGPAQVVTGGQAADASTQHDHGPAHGEPGGEGQRGQADRGTLSAKPPGSALQPGHAPLSGKLRQSPQPGWWEREAPRSGRRTHSQD